MATKLLFRQWLMEAMPNQPQGMVPPDPMVRNATMMATKAAMDAVKKGGDPMKAVQSAVVQQVQQGKLPMNKMGKVMPGDAGQQQQMPGMTQ